MALWYRDFAAVLFNALEKTIASFARSIWGRFAGFAGLYGEMP